MGFQILTSAEYESWYEKLERLAQAQIEKRLSAIKSNGHFGSSRYLDAGLCEIKFSNGIRIYFYRSGQSEITLILGGTKHGQSKDIEKAKRIFNR
jgi:putative addiction module killer protein